MPPRRIPILFLLVALGACATSKDAVLVKTLAGVNAAREAFAGWDAEHQLALVEAAQTREGGATALVEYRAKRKSVTTAFVGAYGALAAASLDGSTLGFIQALGAAQDVLSALRTLGVIAPAGGTQ